MQLHCNNHRVNVTILLMTWQLGHKLVESGSLKNRSLHYWCPVSAPHPWQIQATKPSWQIPHGFISHSPWFNFWTSLVHNLLVRLLAVKILCCFVEFISVICIFSTDYMYFRGLAIFTILHLQILHSPGKWLHKHIHPFLQEKFFPSEFQSCK